MRGSDPADGDEDVDRGTAFRVFFDRPLNPGDLHRGNVGVSSGARNAYLTVTFDPVERVLVLINAGAALDPSVTYRLRVESMRDLDGRRMRRWSIAFRTGDDEGPDRPTIVPRYADVAPIFESRCTDGGCHGSIEPALGLDLSSAEAVARTAIGVPAMQTRTGVQQDAPWSATLGLAGQPRIDVVGGAGRPARSYLLYKVLGDPHVLGARMPPEPAEPLSPAELATLSAWILAGAPTD